MRIRGDVVGFADEILIGEGGRFHLSGVFSVASGEEELTSAQVFAQVNGNLDRYKTLETLYEPGGVLQPFTVTAWFEEETFRRIKASQTGEGGLLTRDFYYDEDGELRFALVTLSADKASAKPPVEERFDFEDDELVRYLGADKAPVLKGQKNFAEMETALVTMSSGLIERIEGSTAYAGMVGAEEPETAKTPAGTIFGAGFADGTFSDAEQGDYFHIDLRQADGEIMTFS